MDSQQVGVSHPLPLATLDHGREHILQGRQRDVGHVEKLPGLYAVEVTANEGLGHILGKVSKFQGPPRKDYSEAEPSSYLCKPPRMGRIPNTPKQEAPGSPSL